MSALGVPRKFTLQLSAFESQRRRLGSKVKPHRSRSKKASSISSHQRAQRQMQCSIRERPMLVTDYSDIQLTFASYQHSTRFTPRSGIIERHIDDRLRMPGRAVQTKSIPWGKGAQKHRKASSSMSCALMHRTVNAETPYDALAVQRHDCRDSRVRSAAALSSRYITTSSQW